MWIKKLHPITCLPTGTWLTFTVTLNQKGQPQARDVQFEPGQMAAQFIQLSQMASPAAYQASKAVAAMTKAPINQADDAGNPGWTNPALLLSSSKDEVKMADADAYARVKMADADAYARVQADIAKFQAQVAALRESNAKLDRDRDFERERSRQRRSRSRSVRSRKVDDLDENP